MQEYFKAIEDTRHQSYIKHRLCDILVMIMCAVLCGLDDLGTVMVYIQNQADFFEQNFGIKETPSKPTVSRVLRMIDGQQVAEVIIRIMREKIGESGDVIAVDGKAIRSTSKDGETHSALQIITAYLTESGLVLGQEKIHEKTNEIPTFQKMLSYLNVSGKTVTADAMHCQKETCKLIVSKGGDYLFGLKENQKTLHDDVALYFQSPPDDAETQAIRRLSSDRPSRCKAPTRRCGSWPFAQTFPLTRRTLLCRASKASFRCRWRALCRCCARSTIS